MENLKEMLEEVKEILVEGYRQRGKVGIVDLIEQFDVDVMVSLVEPIIQAELHKEDRKASL